VVAGKQREADRRVGAGEQQATRRGRLTDEAGAKASDDLAGDAERGDPGDQRESGDQRAVPEALLEVLGEREEDTSTSWTYYGERQI